MTRILNAMLLLALIVGAVLAFRAEARRRALQAEFDRLSVEYGDLLIRDIAKIHVVRLETDDPMCFRFRVHLPAQHDYTRGMNGIHADFSAQNYPLDFMMQRTPDECLATFEEAYWKLMIEILREGHDQ